MSDTPTFANLLTQWSTGGPAVRGEIYAHLRATPAEAAALESFIRAELNAALPARRVIAAEAMVEVYRDEGAAGAALAWVLRRANLAASADAVAVMRKLAPDRAGPLIVDFALHAPAEFRGLAPGDQKWAGETVVRSGERAAELWLALLGHAGPQVESALLMGLADGAGHATSDLSITLEPVRARLLHPEAGFAAGAALWRLTWRVNRAWLATIDPQSPQFENDPLLLALLTDVLCEHLGRRPDLEPLARELLVRLGTEAQDLFVPAVQRVARLGARGWAVLIPILSDPNIPAQTRAVVFSKAAKCVPARLLARPHAHNVILERTRDCSAVPLDLLEAAGRVLYALGSGASSVLPDVLELIAKQPETARTVCPVLPWIAQGDPNATTLVARTLDRLRRSVVFTPDAFAALAKVFAGLNLDGAVALVEDTNLDPRTLECVLQQPAWKTAPTEVRRRHATALANNLSSPAPEVRVRAADALRQYPDQLPTVWPALVALLTSSDERSVVLVLPLFRHLTSVADDVSPELRELLREPNPTLAARAAVALGHLGQMRLVAPELRETVIAATDNARGWAVLRELADRVTCAHKLLHDLVLVFADAPQEIVARVYALLYPPDLDEESAIAVHVPRPGEPTSPQAVDWDGVYQCVGSNPEGGLLFVALMCAFGSGGFTAQKIWLIKHQKALAGTSLAEARDIVERAIDQLTASVAPGVKRGCVREYFRATDALPSSIPELLGHRISWYRWAGLELLDAWGAPEYPAALLEDRIWDRSTLVRTRALRMNQR
ncbi:hypothetical protein J8F10_08140 [Gemmata sp. G18]|uniref:HEAT repeat domain-containing protein n=1 Tax=Gemmata palustris TaxID=2822762 RepID=A0ABS5BNI6_9BACT|nr:hypothetical protein [Gemmata palustris]MBP3955249.1 hypothetical protein [Gemmata palustris]